MSSPPPPSTNPPLISISDGKSDPGTTSSVSSPTQQPSPSRAKLLKIPQIPIHRSPRHTIHEGEEFEDDEEGEDDDSAERRADDPPIVLPSSLGLNHIRTRSAPSPLRFSSSVCAALNFGDESSKDKYTVKPKPKLAPLQPAESMQWNQSKSLRNASLLNPVLEQIFNNIINRDIPWPKVPEEMSPEAYDLIDKLLTDNPVQRLGATGTREVKQHSFFKDINWDTLARQKAMFIPSTDAHDTSYFMSRYAWNPEDEHVNGASDFDDMTETYSSGSCSNIQDEDGDECGSLVDFGAPTVDMQYTFSNFSFKNLSQLASINYDLVVKNAKESPDASKSSVP
ncbi:hypothetical protein C1H46_015741 [Malus baccata]|uniref:non-specific serine/threonine protein kinase n=1 Tax=Malus baccata TaxID=106549 RepID=A0A540MIC4_MALBA|nr:hypothetical protein C1H46_015741 [Malus baccata]